MGTSKSIGSLKYGLAGSIVCCAFLWILIYQERNKTLFIPQDKKKPLCTPETFSIGEWAYYPSNSTNIASRASYHCIKKKFAHRCFNRASATERFRSQKILDYKWEPSQCQTLPFKANLLAEYLIQNPIFFVGDSITQLQFESLSCLLGHIMHKRAPTLNGGNSRLKVEEIGYKDTTAVAYIRSDYLLRLNDFKVLEPFDDTGIILGSGENHPWIHAIKNFKHIVINTAPHWHTNDLWGPNRSERELLIAYKTAMTEVYNNLKKNIQPHQIVWVRNTPYGHAHCSKIMSPQSSPLEPSGKPGEYDWHLFKYFDDIWKNLIVNNLQFRVLDVSTISNKRGDAHSSPDKDCLHTCLPGPVDDWNRLLYHQIMK